MRRLLSVLLTLLPLVAAAEPFPSRPLKWIVPFPPGGPTDSFSRPVAQKLSEVLGQPVVVENIAGAGASIGIDRLAKSPPDGYTVALATTGTHAINPHLYGKRLPYDALEDFTPLTLGVRYVNVLVINPSVPANTVGELVAYAKANPGKVSFGSAGNGSSNHLSGEVLKYVTGAPMEHVPYKGSAPALGDVMAGNLTFMFDILITALPQARAGRVRALAVTSAKRSPFAPDIPTMAESGVKGYSEAGSDLWFGIVAPAGLPKEVTSKLNQALVTALRSPEIRQRISAQSFELWTSTPGEFAQVIRTDYEKWGRIVRAAGARVD
ncbi:MAG: tripartite tricarboxylate transporter substrate binding protein [Betaproteobacteria bacterium]|nr:tripartite tricarboxylate transporter substrate binding protein [Betaproteobacteria bacterium]